MSDQHTEARSVVVERDFAHPPQKVWRALTDPHLLEEWLMKTDFHAQPGQRFSFRADWGAVDCEVLELEPCRTLSYRWDSGDDATGLRSTVTWTLTPTTSGTRLRMEQTGFRKGQPQYYGGAMAGWPRFLDALEVLLGRVG